MGRDKDFTVGTIDATSLKLGGTSGPSGTAGTLVTATAAELNILDGVTATAAEINNAADVSGSIVSIANGTNTLSLTAATHANKKCLVLDATLAITLPEATGTGNVYTVVQGIAATSSTFVTADTTNCHFQGHIIGGDTDADAAYVWLAAGAVDTITYDGTAKGGKIYDWVSFTDIATDVWLLDGRIKQSGGSEATPLSNA